MSFYKYVRPRQHKAYLVNAKQVTLRVYTESRKGKISEQSGGMPRRV